MGKEFIDNPYEVEYEDEEELPVIFLEGDNIANDIYEEVDDVIEESSGEETVLDEYEPSEDYSIEDNFFYEEDDSDDFDFHLDEDEDDASSKGDNEETNDNLNIAESPTD